MDQERILEIKEKLTLPYIAGFFDGEGSITVTKDLSLQVVLGQYFGIGKVSAVKLRRGHKQSYALRWCGKKAAEVLSKLESYLILKHDRALLAIQMQALVVHAHSGKPVPEENKLKRVDLASEIKRINDSHWSRRPKFVNSEVN